MPVRCGVCQHPRDATHQQFKAVDEELPAEREGKDPDWDFLSSLLTSSASPSGSNGPMRRALDAGDAEYFAGYDFAPSEPQENLLALVSRTSMSIWADVF